MNDNNMLDEILQTEAGLTERQKKIILAATEIFAEKGYAATSTSEIAQQAGVAEGTIFRHYRTKKDLLLSIVTPTMIRLMAPLIIKDINKVLNDDYEEFEDFLRAMIENRDRFLKKNMQTIKIFVQEIPFHPELKEQFIEHVANKVLARLQEIVEHYQTNGQLIKLPPTTIIRLIGSTVIGAFAARYVIGNQGKWNDDVEMEHTIQFLLKGLTP
jgi:AcrR family transcriptional regulator